MAVVEKAPLVAVKGEGRKEGRVSGEESRGTK